MLPYKFGNELHVITSTGNVLTKDIAVSTRFMDFTCGIKQSVTGEDEMWYRISTRPAFEVALLRKSTNGEIEIVMMRKPRFSTDKPKPKLPGGYYDDSEDLETFQISKVLHDCGIKMKRLQPCGRILGHGEIQTPIGFFYTRYWEIVGDPRPGVEIEIIPFSKAVELAVQGRVENDSTFSLIMKIDYLIRKNGIGV